MYALINVTFVADGFVIDSYQCNKYGAVCVSLWSDKSAKMAEHIVMRAISKFTAKCIEQHKILGFS